jgi:hypothetical protein
VRKIGPVAAIALLTVLVVTVIQAPTAAPAFGVTAAKIQCFGFNADVAGDVVEMNIYNPSGVTATYQFKIWKASGFLQSFGETTVGAKEVDTIKLAFNSGSPLARSQIKVIAGPPALAVDASATHETGTESQSERQVTCQKV